MTRLLIRIAAASLGEMEMMVALQDCASRPTRILASCLFKFFVRNTQHTAEPTTFRSRSQTNFRPTCCNTEDY